MRYRNPASFTPWFKDYPYPYASADATPLFMIVMNDYVTASGDIAYAKEKWASIWKAYEFLRSTYDARGFPSEHRLRSRLGGRRPAAAGKDRALSKRAGAGSIARAVTPCVFCWTRKKSAKI